MKLLLDTHTLLRWLNDDRKLEQQARELVADPGHDVLVNAVSLWEIAVKVRVGKLEADIEEITVAVQKEDFTLLDISAALSHSTRQPTAASEPSRSLRPLAHRAGNHGRRNPRFSGSEYTTLPGAIHHLLRHSRTPSPR